MQENQQEMMKGFERMLEVEGVRSRGDYLARIGEFLSWALERGYGWESLRAGLQEGWTGELLERGLSRRSVNNKLNTRGIPLAPQHS